MRKSPDTPFIEHLNHRAPEGPRDLGRAVALLAGLGAAYAISIALLGVGGGSPGMAPWIALPQESYFLVESAFVAPVIVASALLASTTAYLLARACGSGGTFDGTVIVIARATCIATLFSLIPDFVMGATTAAGLVDGAALAADLVRPSAWRTFLWIYLGLYTVAFLVLYPKAVRVAHPALHTPTTTAIGWIAFALYQGVLLVFIR